MQELLKHFNATEVAFTCRNFENGLYTHVCTNKAWEGEFLERSYDSVAAPILKTGITVINNDHVVKSNYDKFEKTVAIKTLFCYKTRTTLEELIVTTPHYCSMEQQHEMLKTLRSLDLASNIKPRMMMRNYNAAHTSWSNASRCVDHAYNRSKFGDVVLTGSQLLAVRNMLLCRHLTEIELSQVRSIKRILGDTKMSCAQMMRHLRNLGVLELFKGEL